MVTPLSLLRDKQLTRMLEEKVKPKGAHIDSMRAAVDKFTRFLHTLSDDRGPYKVARVVEGGSLGKGTAVRGMSDIDLEVVFTGLTSIKDLQDKREELLDKIEKGAKRHNWKGTTITQTKRTSYSIQFRLNGKDIDALPVFDIEKHLGSPDKIYKEMEDYRGSNREAAQEYSASLCELQIKLVKDVDSKVKDVIRLLKFWKKKEGLDIRSYSIELLALHMSRRYRNVSIEMLFRRCMGKLACCHDICISFDENYNSRRYVGLTEAPYILDPANPLMNTMDGVNVKEVTRRANNYFHKFYKNNPGVPALNQSRSKHAITYR